MKYQELKVDFLFSLILLSSLTTLILTQEQVSQEVLQEYQRKRSKVQVESPLFGLRAEVNNQQIELPLKKLHYNVNIQNSLAEIEMIQEYSNSYNNSIETEYFFAINPKSAFTSIEAELNDIIITGSIKDKQTAKQEYNQAISEGKTAVYGEIVEELHDVMKLNLGSLKPGKTARIILKYVEQLDVLLNKFWRFSIGNTFSDRSNNSPQASENLIKACNPQQISQLSKDAYPWYIHVNIQSPSPITFLQSPSHPLSISYKNAQTASIDLDVTKEFFPNKEFVLLYRNENINKPQVTLEYDKSDPQMPFAAQLTFFPDFNSEDIQETYNNFLRDKLHEFKYNSTNLKGEFIFIIDRSGSMDGDRIQMTKSVLSELINQIPSNSYFNIISFGSSYITMFPFSVPKNEENLHQASKQIASIDSNMGGTEIYSPLKFALESVYIPRYPKNIILLTDGQVYNVNSCLSLTKQYAHKVNLRVSAVGIGNGVSKEFISNLAEEGKGKAIFIEDLQMMNEKMAYLLRDSFTPFLENIKIELPKEYVKVISPLPSSIKAIRKNEPFTIYLLLQENLETCQVNFSCYDSVTDQEKYFTIQIQRQNAQKSDIIHKIAINKIIKSLLSNAYYGIDPLQEFQFDNNENYIEKIKNLSIKYQVLSEFTAFILVNNNETEINLNQKPQKVNIPVVESIDYIAQTNLYSKGVNQKMYAKQKTESVGSGVNPTPQYHNQAQPQKSYSSLLSNWLATFISILIMLFLDIFY